jgi:hypothetical protein
MQSAWDIEPDESDEVVCHRCGTPREPTGPVFYVVKIEAFAEPDEPAIRADDLARDFERELRELLEQARDLSERELMDQVYRRVTLHLCPACYQQWIEDPVGSRG